MKIDNTGQLIRIALTRAEVDTAVDCWLRSRGVRMSGPLHIYHHHSGGVQVAIDSTGYVAHENTVYHANGVTWAFDDVPEKSGQTNM